MQRNIRRMEARPETPQPKTSRGLCARFPVAMRKCFIPLCSKLTTIAASYNPILLGSTSVCMRMKVSPAPQRIGMNFSV